MHSEDQGRQYFCSRSHVSLEKGSHGDHELLMAVLAAAQQAQL